MNHLGRKNFKAYSAGSTPKGEVNPFTLEILEMKNHDTGNLKSKSWHQFAAPDAPAMHFIFTLCDKAAGESCPIWPGQPVTADWGFADPAAVEGTKEQKLAAFARTYREISQRIRIFLNLPFEKLDHLSLQQHLDEMGQRE
jgi:arsenate reductase